MAPPDGYTAVQISALSLLVAAASTRLVHVRAGALVTIQSVGNASAVVDNTKSAPAGTPANECVVIPTPVFESKLWIATGGALVPPTVVNDQL